MKKFKQKYQTAIFSIITFFAIILSFNNAYPFAYIFAGEAFGIDIVTHPIGYMGAGGVVEVSVGIDPTSVNAASMVIPAQNAIIRLNERLSTITNLQFGLPSGDYDFESVLLHEMGHSNGLAHCNIGARSGVSAAERDYTISTDGADNVFGFNAGVDGVIGTKDDVRGDDVNLNFFKKTDNNPFTAPGVIDQSTYSRNLADLPSGNYATNAARDVGAVSGFSDTEAVMQQGTFNTEYQRTLGADDVAGLRYAMAGLNEIAGNSDDYVLRLTYAGLTTIADIVMDFDNTETGFAVSQNSGVFLNADHLGITSTKIFFNAGFNWYFNNQAIPLTFTAPNDLCTGVGVQSGLGGGSPVGGTYSGLGVTDDGNGLTYSFNPSLAGQGTHPITYTNGTSVTDNVGVGLVKTWTGVAWSPTGAPNSANAVTIEGTYNAGASNDGNLDVCSLTIMSGANVIIPPSAFVKVDSDIIVDGELNVSHQGSLVQVDDAATVTNNGVINVFVDTPELDGRDFMLLGSPMSTDTRQGAFAGAQRVRNHLTGSFSPNSAVASTSPGAGNWVDEEGDDWPVYTGVNINPGEGYMVMRNINGPPESLNLTFNTGTLNNGVITYAAGYNGTQNSSPNIIANPYASAISATDFINENTSVDAVYFWEHRTTPTGGIPGPYGLDYTMEDISLFNLTGGTSAAASDPSTTPNGIISTGQGFAVKVASAGLISFKNAMRRTSGNSTLRSQDFDRVWLNVQSEGYELNSTALIGFLDQATNGIDVGYDANRLATNVSLYSHLDDGSAMLGIQARGVFEENIKISMGFATLIDDALAYSISLQNIEGLNLSTATAYLIDNQLDTVTNLNETNYTFVSKKGVFNNRFTLQFTPEVVLGVNNNTLEKLSVYPNPTQNTVTIVSPQIAVRSATVYDLRGRSVAEVDFSNTTSYQIDLSAMESALYFIEIATESGLVMKRIIKN